MPMTSCPICTKDDGIQKVSAMVAAGKASGTFIGPTGGLTYSDGTWGSFGGYTALNATMTSDLAKLLAPPREPEKGWKGPHWFYQVLVTPFFLTLPIVFVFSLWCGAMSFLTRDGWILGVPMLGVGGLSFLAIVLGVVGLFWYGARERKKADVRYAEEKPRWDAAKKKWDRLYFCHRDGVVFDPESGQTCQPEAVKAFVYL